jgi:hypothetical protein
VSDSSAKIAEYLISARGYCDPHPGLTRAQLLLEMERSRRTLDYVLGLLDPKASEAYKERMLELAECED